MLHELLRREGLVTNRKRRYRIHSELGMQVRTKRRKRLVRSRVPLSSNQAQSAMVLGPTSSDGAPLKQGFDYFFGYPTQVAAHNYTGE